MNISDALCQLRAGDSERALVLLDLCLQRDGAWYAAQGMILQAAGKPQEARRALAQAMSLGDMSPATVLNLALAEEGAGRRDRARVLMRGLTVSVPDWDEPWLRLAESARREGDHVSAADAYECALERNPLRAEALIGLAALRIGAGDGAGAQTLLLRCLGSEPGHAEGWDALGLALLLTGDAAAAESAFAQAQQRAPDNYDYALRRVRAAYAAGHAEAELSRLEVATMEKPLDPVLPMARAALLYQTGRHDAALDAMETAVLLAPEATVPAMLLGDMLTRSPRGADAIVALRRALTLRPHDLRVGNNLGAILMRQHQPAEAARVLRDIRAHHGDDPVCLCNLANAMALLGEQDEAVAIARQAIAVAPDAMLSYRALANVLPYHPDTSPADLLAALQAISNRLPREKPAFENVPDAGRRLRLGLLSGSLRTHPVGWLTVAGFENLDPAGFEIHCLAQNASHDPIARRFRAIAAGWHDIDALDDMDLAVFSRSLGIDVLIDLGGYGDAGRMPACARRLAPVQVKWVGMQNHSTGLADMDWFITDRWETPADRRMHYTERLLRLPDGYVCYSPPSHAPDVEPLPASKNGFITFGCFNNLAKITPLVVETWSDILRNLPASRLILKTHQLSDAKTRSAMASKFAAFDIAPDRLEFRGASPHREFLGQYGDVDIVLDPFPYTGGLTTCEALWMGVPTVTIAGEIFAARHSHSHLSNVGLDEWVAHNRAGYVDLALRKATDIEALDELRQNLRMRVKVSPLCDAPRFGRHLGAALRHAWTDWCANA